MSAINEESIQIWTMAKARRYHRAWRVRQPFRQWARQTLLKRQALGKLERVLRQW